MISEEDIRRYHVAKNCNDCLSWYNYCKAECCKIIFLGISLEQLNKSNRYVTVKPTKDVSVNMRWYYHLRDVQCVRGLLRFRKDKVVAVGRRIIYIHPCELLDEQGRCKGHPDKKPEICKLLTPEAAMKPNRPFILTDNCLFRYKLMEVDDDGTEEGKDGN